MIIDLPLGLWIWFAFLVGIGLIALSIFIVWIIQVVRGKYEEDAE